MQIILRRHAQLHSPLQAFPADHCPCRICRTILAIRRQRDQQHIRNPCQLAHRCQCQLLIPSPATLPAQGDRGFTTGDETQGALAGRTL